MKALKFDLEVPFWCSFGDFSSLNIKLSYPIPPLTTLFGLIQNALGKPALHNIENNNMKKNIMKQYNEDFNHLKFSIIIKDSGEKIEDYLNIHKGNRKKEKFEENLKKHLESFIKNQDNEEDLKKEIKHIKKYSFYKYLLNGSNCDENFEDIFNEINNLNSVIIDEVKNYWENSSIGIQNYEINKIWLSTQINRQRLINPLFSIYICSDLENDAEFSLINIKKALERPKRPLYLGENDDVVNILNLSIVDIKENSSSNISSVLPDLYSNCEVVKIPTNLKFNKDKQYLTLCSIPNGELDQEVKCYSYDGENFVFL